MKVKPKVKGAVVRDPHTMQALPEEGGEVQDNNFWFRRLMDGDVVLIDETKHEPKHEAKHEAHHETHHAKKKESP